MTCDLCGNIIAPHAHYIVRIDVFADPTLPQISVEELASNSLDNAMAELIEHMKTMSTEELKDQVHRRFEYTLCRACQVNFLQNPLGKPRFRQAGAN